MNSAQDKVLVMLTDYRRFFYHSVRHKDAGMDIELVIENFNREGWEIIIKKYPEIDFRNDNYQEKFILYQSSEDRDLFYKSYIEDILLGLELQGAILIPNFYYFRAHHNKVFMEILRDLSHLKELRNIKSKSYGTYEEFSQELSLFPSKCVLKPSEGCGSSGIKLLQDEYPKKKYAKKVSRSLHLIDALKNIIKCYLRRPYIKKSNNRKKFIIQNYIPDLNNDYKILIYGDKYYVLFRHNRKNDFRASGSGIFEYKEHLPEGLLDFAERVFKSFETPYLSIDVGFNGHEFFLIEFQYVNFGNYTIEKSPFYFIKEGEKWITKRKRSILEEEFVKSVIRYINNYTFV